MEKHDNFFIFNDPHSSPKPIIKSQYLCLTTIFFGFTAELFVLLTEFRHLKVLSHQYKAYSAETDSIDYKNSTLVAYLIKIILLYGSMFICIYKLKYFWRHFHSNTKFSLLIFLYAENVVNFIPSIHKTFFVERKFGFNKTTIPLFLRDFTLKLVMHFSVYVLFIVPVCFRANKVDLPAPLKRRTKLHIVEYKAKDIGQIDDNTDELSPVDLIGMGDDDSEEGEDGNAFFEHASNFWAFTTIHLFFIVLLCSFIYPYTDQLFITMKPLPKDNNTNKYNAIMSGFKHNNGKDLQLLVPTRNTHMSYGIHGYWSAKPFISEQMIELFQLDELKAIGKILNTQMKTKAGFNILRISYNLFPVIFYGMIFRQIMRTGVAPYGVQRGRPIAIVCFISFCFFYTCHVFAQTFIFIVERKAVIDTDISVAKKGYNIKNALIKIYRINHEAVSPSLLFRNFYDSIPPLAERVDKIEKYISSKPQLASSLENLQK
ncbi:hypothetical protein TVAG_342990 [Trichomonas vaginalis G3]|uniref:CAAX prenyl protease 1 N-terminal domain-containing protein n=1 Tax=Trichomonas vaginalis (strain ATCC PRA-98 / G3) TaxID=412133 RepID=A2EJR1_TRIV3|nr:CAAX prenyl protease 1 family [Trichomonas vaginalis G3]EAY07135.1 hypothetical protein TVAG_342990 [Trichomonas vaginalis G3]KAI5522490.1 CAAX prenyl protease 1 family [Trichomonas vaginalis G3]|eukprot:XP_001319358.1 hypothetical protein [Trichomonas vaginalis G3]